jgi:hypothetical protein
MVLQPRALVGVVKPRDTPLRITRPWRPGYLLSWLTFRLRFVVFHGPCSLLVEGHRGVRVEYAGAGRTIDRRLVLGFEAGATLGAARSASLLPYLRGRAGLFTDRFAGDGCFVYQHRPSATGGGGLWGRGLKGLGDAVLNVLGI